MTRIIEKTQRKIESKYKHSPNKPDMKVVWTSERNESMNEHHHLFFSVNGNAIQNGYAIKAVLDEVIDKYLGHENSGLVNYSDSNGKYGIMIDRNSEDYDKQIAAAIYAGSYLAKENSKGHIPKGARISSASRLPAGWREKKEKAIPSTSKQPLEITEEMLEEDAWIAWFDGPTRDRDIAMREPSYIELYEFDD